MESWPSENSRQLEPFERLVASEVFFATDGESIVDRNKFCIGNSKSPSKIPNRKMGSVNYFFTRHTSSDRKNSASSQPKILTTLACFHTHTKMDCFDSNNFSQAWLEISTWKIFSPSVSFSLAVSTISFFVDSRHRVSRTRNTQNKTKFASSSFFANGNAISLTDKYKQLWNNQQRIYSRNYKGECFQIRGEWCISSGVSVSY